MSSTTRWVIVALSVLGLGFAGASTWVHYRLLTDQTYVSPCDVSAAFNCSQVYLSRYGSIAGIPVAIGGLIWFGLTALIAGFAQPAAGEKSPAAGYLLALSFIGLAAILYLGYISYAVLATGCLLCMGTYAGVIGIFIATLMSRPVALAELPGRLTDDLRSAVAQPVVLVAGVIYLTASLGAVTLFPGEGEMAAASAPTAAQQTDFGTAWAQQPRLDLGIDPEGAAVVVVKFNDFECPACRQAEAYYKPVLDRFAASHPGAVKYVIRDWPLDASCNFHMMSTIPGHEAACDAAAAARMARDRGQYQEMVDWIYANQAVSKAELRAAAQRILGVADFDREYAQHLPDIRKDIADGGALNITQTPTYFINGVKVGGLSPAQFEMAVQLEIQAAADQQGS